MANKRQKRAYRKYTITLPNGNVIYLYRDEETDAAAVIEKMVLSNWSRYISNNWQNYRNGDKFCPEMKIKWQLEGCANFLLQGNLKGSNIQTYYKRRETEDKEIAESSCSAHVLRLLESGEYEIRNGVQRHKKMPFVKAPPVKAQEPRRRFEKQWELKVSGTLVSAVVDTENRFFLEGEAHEISEEVECYKPKQTQIGLLYDSDRVYCYKKHKDSKWQFYDDDLRCISQHVERVRLEDQ